MLRLYFADGGKKARVIANLEVFARIFLWNGRSELAEAFAVFDINVEIFGGIRVEGLGENAAVAQRARAKFHAPLHPGDYFVVV